MPILKVIFMGTPDFAIAPLQALLLDPEIEVLAVVTREDKKVGRKQEMTAPPMKQFALTKNLPVLQVEKLKDNKEFQTLLKNLKPDFIIVVAFGQILTKEILEIPKYGCINIHPSLLPKYRGPTPVEAALLEGESETGVAIMEMTEKFDSGKIFIVKKIPLEKNDNAQTLYLKLFLIGAQILCPTLKDIAEGNIKGIAQDEKKATYCQKIQREDGFIDVKKLGAEDILRRIRAYTPWPSCYMIVKGKRLKILEAEIDASENENPGKITELPGNRISIETLKGVLLPLKVQLEGKSVVKIEDFIRGNREIITP